MVPRISNTPGNTTHQKSPPLDGPGPRVRAHGFTETGGLCRIPYSGERPQVELVCTIAGMIVAFLRPGIVVAAIDVIELSPETALLYPADAVDNRHGPRRGIAPSAAMACAAIESSQIRQTPIVC